jgi:MFS family permease
MACSAGGRTRLPSIQKSLHASVGGLQWVVDAYTLVIACLLMFSGSVADRFGRRRVFQVGLGPFPLGSVLCGLAHSLGVLVAFRALQVVGGAMRNPVAMSIIATTFAEPKDRVSRGGHITVHHRSVHLGRRLGVRTGRCGAPAVGAAGGHPVLPQSGVLEGRRSSRWSL